MSNNSVIKNARRYCKTLLKYARANEKQLLKKKSIQGIKKIRDEEDRIIKKIKGHQIDEKQLLIIKKKIEKLNSFGNENKLVKQLTDLALLSNNMLKGEDLSRFVKRSIELM